MTKTDNKLVIPDEFIMNQIYLIRELKVMLDSDLAELYQVETRRLNEQVKRNIDRFPDDFMLTDNLSVKLEIEEIKKKLYNQDKNIELVFKYLDELIDKQATPKPRKRIGFNLPNEHIQE